MAKIGYARVSTHEQNLDLQLAALQAANCDETFVEKVSGVKERPELRKALAYLRKGDTLVVYKFDRIGRSLKDLINIFSDLQKRDIGIVSIQDNIDASSASGRLMLHIFAALAEFERDLIIDRCQGGRKEAMKRGVKFGRPKKKKESKTKACAALYKSGIGIKDIMEQLNIKSKSTLYRYLRMEGVNISRNK
jgi:DNA invertase Pin-like site-specific DNA recombinase